MSPKKKKKKKQKVQESSNHDVFFVVQLFVGLLLFFSIYGYELMGPFGSAIQIIGFNLFSDAFALLPWVILVTSGPLVASTPAPISRYYLNLSVFTLFFLTLIDSIFLDKMMTNHGEISWAITDGIIHFGAQLFGEFGVRFLCFAISITFGVMLFHVSIANIIDSIKQLFRVNPEVFFKNLKYRLFYQKQSSIIKKKKISLKKKKDDFALKKIKDTDISDRQLELTQPQLPPKEMVIVSDTHVIEKSADETAYVLPPLDLLQKPRKSNAKQIENDMRQKSKLLEMALESFNVKARVVNITVGPSVSRFELQPGEGVKISKITNLSQDIALKLAVPTVRIEAPIPGKALIGIEVPNADIAPLNLRSIIDPKTFFKTDLPLECILGQRITGEGVTMNLNKMPHILVAGSTGSGKSVCVNAIIISILMKATPDEVKFLMIDPKKVELSLYSDIPHLLAPVVTNPHKAAATLKQWALVEMERRYELFTEHGVKDLAGFNAMAKTNADPDVKPIPYIVVIIDEFADLMMVASQEVENTICRLAQMARATGIHLVIATQRPSVNVVTGLIKANVPSRISFAVQSQIDSRTVLDMAGAEKLLGRGDMLYMPVGASKPDRVQGVFVSEQEVNGVVKFIKNQGGPNYVDEVMEVEVEEKETESDQGSDPNKDELFNQAKEMIQSTQYASTSYLQRKLRIGYNRAARLMDELEEAGVISAYDNESKTRTVLPG